MVDALQLYLLSSLLQNSSKSVSHRHSKIQGGEHLVEVAICGVGDELDLT